MNTPSDAYFAGFVDGEGCIGFYRQNHRRDYCRLQVQTVNSDRAVLDLLCERFGGSVFARKRAEERHSQTWAHGVTGAAAHAMIVALRPYLIIKADRADQAIAAYTATHPEVLAA